MRRAVALVLAFTGLLMLAAPGCGDGGRDEGSVHILRATGVVGPIMERYIDRGIGKAEGEGALMVVIEMDTPGGLSESMRDIIRRIERAEVPVAVYVTPPGGRAASAGTFIAMTAHVAAMAPNTSIGAAAAINSDGSNIDGTLGSKIENDAVALIRGLAEARGRNADWAEQAVREAVAVTATEAVRLNVVDFMAQTTEDLLAQSEGREVILNYERTVTLSGLTEAPIVRTDYTVWERFLSVISDPTIASILISLGFMGLLFELGSPGTFVPGILGSVAMLIGFLGFGILPVDTVGLVLIFLALVLFGLELFVPSGGILGGGAALALILGGIIAFRDTPAEFRPPTELLIVLGAGIIGIFAIIGVAVARMSRWAADENTRNLIGRVAVARTDIAPFGYVFIAGERWMARTEAGRIEEGDPVRILAADGFVLHVAPERPA